MNMSKHKPPWLRRRLPSGPAYEQVRNLLKDRHLHTVCQEARCPNIWECFSQKTATFLILGDRCTRNCGFCAVEHGVSGPPDANEPERVADAVEQMGLHYVVITSVTRDDLEDGGAGLFADTIGTIRNRMPEVFVEVLTPDFKGNFDAVKTVVCAGPNVFNHNIETVSRLYPIVRPQADYNISLNVLKTARQINPKIITKSGIMLGLGENENEITEVFQDLLTVGCNILTMGQYLQPTKEHIPVKRFVPPEEFQKLKHEAMRMGFSSVAAGPFIRSSYHAKDLFKTL
ncbi:MAG: lipoyl synthase [Desulfobacterales bacterium]